MNGRKRASQFWGHNSDGCKKWWKKFISKRVRAKTRTEISKDKKSGYTDTTV